MRIKDNGVGFDPQALRPGHFGIVGLREQAEIIGAQLLIESKPNEGTEVIVSLRLPPISFAQARTIPGAKRAYDAEEQLQRAIVNAMQPIDVRDPHALVHLVDGLIDHAEFDHLRAHGRDEPPVRGAAARSIASG